MTTHGMHRVTLRAYRWTLQLYPKRFRDRYEQDMLHFVRARLASPEYRGWRVLRLWPTLASDLLRTVTTGRLETFADETRGQAPSVLDTHEDMRRYPEAEIMDVLLHDIRFGARALRKRPGYAAVAILTLALGIGATTTIFSVVNAVLLRPLPFPDADRVAVLWSNLGGKTSESLLANYADMMDFRARSHSIESIGIMRGMSVNLTGIERPDRLSGMFASAETFNLLGARTVLGRTFDSTEAVPGRGAPVAVLSYGTWDSRFGADRNIIGRTINLNAKPTTVIGVLTQDFYTPLGGSDIWLPISSIPTQATFVRGNPNVWAVARLRPRVSIDAARRELNAIAADLARAYPTTNAGVGANVVALRDQIVGTLRGSLLTILAAVGLLLVIACANVANLQLARAATREHEIATRVALGASSGRIIRQLLTESVLLAVVGGTLGVLLSKWAVAAVPALVPGGLPTSAPVSMDARVLVFALGATILSALLFGLVPAIRSARADLRGALGIRSSAGQPGGRAGTAISVAQLALCTSLLIVAGLLTRSLSRLRGVDPGFDASHVLGAEFRLPISHYGPESTRVAFFERALAELRAVPGAQSAALASSLPLSGNFNRNTYEIFGRPSEAPDARPRTYAGLATDGYFRTLGIPLVAGRDFSPDDRLGRAPVVIVNQTLAHRAWPGENPVGQQLRLQGDTAWSTVIGVVGDTKELTLAEPEGARVYGALLQNPGIFATVALRTSGDPAQSTDALRHAIWSVDRDQPVWRIRPLAENVAMSTQEQRFTVTLTIAFASLALLLGAIGVYGVMAHAVAQRTKEIGLRVALGASRGRMIGMVLQRVLRVSAFGAVLGIALAAAAGNALGTQLFGIAPYDPVTFATVPVLLFSVAMIAAYAPARRASRVDPMEALRAE